MRMRMIASGLLAGWALTAPASAEIIESHAGGFASRNSAIVAASRAHVWAMLIRPEAWWSHTFSGAPANLSLEPRAGGCFCEALPATDGASEAGSAEHMRVVLVQPGAMLRMTGALGPLQAEGLAGTLTVTLSDAEGGTRIDWDYVVGGQWRFAPGELEPAVDNVQREFLDGLVKALGGGATRR